MAQVQGHCEAAFAPVRSLLEELIASGEELGASIVVNIDGKEVLDIYGGYSDESRTLPWKEDTIVNVWSSTKTVSSLAVLMLVDRGLLDVNEKVAKYWPEFAANGKQDIEVRHFLSHTSGVSGWDQPITVEDICDVESSTKRLAQQAPWWTPGSASGYHALNMGHLLGELVRRTTGKSLKQFVAEEIAGPLGADFQIGAREEDWPRISNVVPPPPGLVDFSSLPQDSPAVRTFTGPTPNAPDANTAVWRRGEIGAANGHGNARSLNRILSVIPLGGAIKSTRLLSPKTIDLIFQEQANGIDIVLGIPLRFGIGYGLPAADSWFPSKSQRLCFWGGWGGSVVLMDVDRKVTVTYVMNKMGAGTVGTERTMAYVKKIYEVLDATN